MTNIEVILMVGGGLFMLFMTLFAVRLLSEVKGMRHDLTDFQLTTTKAVGQLEVKVDHLEAKARCS